MLNKFKSGSCAIICAENKLDIFLLSTSKVSAVCVFFEEHMWSGCEW